MATVPLSRQAQDLQRELEGPLLKLEKLGLLRADASDHVRTIVAEDIRLRLNERYRLFPCGPRQEGLEIRCNALPPKCVLQSRLEEVSSGKRPSTPPQQQQQQQQQQLSSKKSRGRRRNTAANKPAVSPSPAQSIATSSTEAKATKARIQDWATGISTDPLPMATTPDKNNVYESLEKSFTKASDEPSHEVLIDISTVNDSNLVAMPSSLFAKDQLLPVMGTILESVNPSVCSSATVIKKEDDYDDENDDYHDAAKLKEKEKERQEEGGNEKEVKKEDDSNGLSWLGSPLPKVIVAKVEKDEDLIDLGY